MRHGETSDVLGIRIPMEKRYQCCRMSVTRPYFQSYNHEPKDYVRLHLTKSVLLTLPGNLPH